MVREHSRTQPNTAAFRTTKASLNSRTSRRIVHRLLRSGVPEPGLNSEVWPTETARTSGLAEGLALPRCSVLLLLTVLVSGRQLMSGGQYLPGVKGVCVACQQPANKICAFSSCSSPTCPSCSTMVMLPDEDRNLHYCVQHGVPAHHAIRMFNSMDSFNQARFGKSSSTVSPALNIVSRLSDQHVSAPPGRYDVLPPVPVPGCTGAATAGRLLLRRPSSCAACWQCTTRLW